MWSSSITEPIRSGCVTKDRRFVGVSCRDISDGALISTLSGRHHLS